MRAVVVFSALFVGITVAGGGDKQNSADLSNGFGTDIDWVPWPDAVSTALDLEKPIFLLIHKTWCGACKALKNSLATSSKRKEYVELSQKFVMANTEDDDEPEDEEYAPDGRYIPRLFFLDKYGKRLAVDNKKNYANNAHYFPQMTDVIKAMKLALKLNEQQAAASLDEPVKLPAEEKTGNKNATKKETAKKDDDESAIVETPGAEHLGEMQLTEDQLAFMESGGCPHAAAARAAMIEAERAVEENEKAKKTEKTDDEKATTETKNKKAKKTAKAEETEKKPTPKTEDKKEKAKTADEKAKTTAETDDKKDKKVQKTSDEKKSTSDVKAKKKESNTAGKKVETEKKQKKQSAALKNQKEKKDEL